MQCVGVPSGGGEIMGSPGPSTEPLQCEQSFLVWATTLAGTYSSNHRNTEEDMSGSCWGTKHCSLADQIKYNQLTVK